MTRHGRDLSGPGQAAACLLFLVLLTPCAAPGRLAAQIAHLEVGVHLALSTHTEVSDARRSRGFGFGASALVRRDRFSVESHLVRVPVSADVPTPASFDVSGYDILVGYAVKPWLAIEGGGGRRNASPTIQAENVGWVQAGLRFETPLASIARMWVRGAVLPVTRFSTGGKSGAAFAVGFGVAVGPADSRFGGRIEYDFHRLGRTVTGLKAPVLLETARIGVTARLF